MTGPASAPEPRAARPRRFDWDNLGLRIVSGVVLGTAVVAIQIWLDPRADLVLIAVATSLMSYEWARMAAPTAWRLVAVVMTVAVLAVLFLTYRELFWWAAGAGAVGVLATAIVSRGVTERRLDAAYGVLYVAPAAMALMWLRQMPQGAGWTVMLFATTWAADVCAFAVGNVLKGPKLWPRYSPNKTWSGFFGGLAGASGTAVGVAALLMHLSLWGAALIGLVAGLATMMGDLWESMLKRRFGVKDSGDLIPGHGGLLDRVDGLMFATLVFAAARLIVHFGVGPLMARTVTILGSTGSVGVSTLDLLDKAGADVEIVVLTAGRNVAKLAEQAKRWRPRLVVIEDEALLPELRERLNGSNVHATAGAAAIVEAAGMGADWVMSAIVGSAGLAPTLAAARTGSIIALANKESLICAGPALLAAAKAAGGSVIPVDSEHSAIFQVLQPLAADRISRLILTASGGPFRGWSRDQMAVASVEQAVAHPNWSMGRKISVDSAQMMNKGLEMIEASYLFDMPPEQIDVLIHPQSIVHSMVEYADGSTLAQLGPPDMRTPIACAWAWPDRTPWPAPRLDLAHIGQLTFEAPDEIRFPALAMARDALRAGGGAPAAMNAANEIGVAAFLDRQIGFLDIAALVAETLEALSGGAELAQIADEADPLEWAMTIDAGARRTAAQVLSRFAGRG